MIQFSRQGNGLKDFVNSVQFIDTDTVSRNYFRILDFPSRMYVGKNSFSIVGNNKNLVKGSRIYIDVVDSNGNIIYHEVLDIVNKDNSRKIIVYIYSDTPPGEATVYIAGRLAINPITGESIPYSNSSVDPNYKNRPNVMWSGKTSVVTNKQNNSEVFFIVEPTVTYREKFSEFKIISGSNSRELTVSGSGTEKLSMVSRIQPSQYSDNIKTQTSYIDNVKTFRSIPDGLFVTGESKNAKQLPEFTELSIIKSNTPIFNSSMVGGIISLTDISNPIPDYTDGQKEFTYSASIVRVISDTVIQVDTPYIKTFEYVSVNDDSKKIVFNSFYNHPNYTIRYFNTDVELATAVTIASESFVTMDFRDIEPVAGAVDKIKISYKAIGSFGDFIDVGEFPVKTQNLLVDTSSQVLTLESGIVDRGVGFFQNAGYYNAYWTASGGTIPSASIGSDKVLEGVTINHRSASTEDRYAVVKLNNNLLLANKNTEYKLKFKSHYDQEISGSWNIPFMDVYISGSGIITDIINRSDLPIPKKDLSLGTFIGTVSGDRGRIRENEFYFKVLDRKNITPVFVARAGTWSIGEIEVIPRKEIGFSPNHTRFNIPLTQLQKSTELIIDIKYLNSDGIKANLDTVIYGVYFSGSGDLRLLDEKIDEVSSSLADRVTDLEASGSSGSGGPTDWEDITGKPTVVSGSTQIDYGGITGVPSGIISSSTQIADDISGSFVEVSGSITTRITTNESSIDTLNNSGLISSSTQIADDISGSFVEDSASFEARIFALEIASGSNSGSVHWDNILSKPTVISSSAQIAEDISGSFGETSSSLETRITNNEIVVAKTLVSSSAQISNDISGSFGDVSSSLETRITSTEDDISTLNNSGLISGSGQISEDISGSFTDLSGSMTTRLTTNESNISTNTSDITTLNNSGLISSSTQIADDISGSFGDVSSSFESRISNNEVITGKTLLSGSAQISEDISGSFTSISGSITGRLTTNESNISTNTSDITTLNNSGLISSSDQLSEDISGSFGEDSGSFSTRITSNEDDINTLNSSGLLSSSAQISQDISGSFGDVSSSLESRISTNEVTIAKPLLSGSAQISEDISGSFTSVSGSITTRLTTNESNISTNTSDITTLNNSGLISSSDQVDFDLLKDNPFTASGLNVTTDRNMQINGTVAVNDDMTVTGKYEGYVTESFKLINLDSTDDIIDIDLSNSDTVFIGGSAGTDNSGSAIFIHGGIYANNITASLDYSNLDNVPSGIVSSSDQLADEISGSFTEVSSSFETRITNNEVVIAKTLVSSSNQISTEISGAFTSDSSSFEVRITNSEVTNSLQDTDITNLQNFSSSLKTFYTDDEYITDYTRSITTLDKRIEFVADSGDDWGSTFVINGSVGNDNGSGSTSEGGGYIGFTTIRPGKTGWGGGGALLSVSAEEASIILEGFDQTGSNKGDFIISQDGFDVSVRDGGNFQFKDFNSSPKGIEYVDNYTSSLGDNSLIPKNLLDFVSQSVADDIATLNSKSLISGSEQIADEISGSFTEVSSSFETRITNNEVVIAKTLVSSSNQISTEISGAFGEDSSSFETRITTNESDITTLNNSGLLSSSAQISEDISGSFIELSGSISTRFTNDEADIASNTSAIDTLNNSGLISSSDQLSDEISGSFTEDSSSFETRITTNESDITTLNSSGLLSSSAQISEDISGSFTEISGSIASDIVTTNNTIATVSSSIVTTMHDDFQAGYSGFLGNIATSSLANIGTLTVPNFAKSYEVHVDGFFGTKIWRVSGYQLNIYKNVVRTYNNRPAETNNDKFDLLISVIDSRTHALYFENSGSTPNYTAQFKIVPIGANDFPGDNNYGFSTADTFVSNSVLYGEDREVAQASEFRLFKYTDQEDWKFNVNAQGGLDISEASSSITPVTIDVDGTFNVANTASFGYGEIDGNESWHKGNLPTVISSSAQLSDDISGSFTEDSSSFESRITINEATVAKTLLSGSAQISEDISGSFTSLSGSISTRFTTNETDFTNFSSSYSTRITTNETNDTNTSSSFELRITELETTSSDLVPDVSPDSVLTYNTSSGQFETSSWYADDYYFGNQQNPSYAFDYVSESVYARIEVEGETRFKGSNSVRVQSVGGYTSITAAGDIFLDYNADLIARYGGTNQFSIDGATGITFISGSTGFGTISPSRKVEISSDGAEAYLFAITNTVYGSTGMELTSAGGKTQLFDNNGIFNFRPDSGYTYFAGPSVQNRIILMDYDTPGSSYALLRGADLVLVNSGSSDVVISRNGDSFFRGGNVGFGESITNAGYPIDVQTTFGATLARFKDADSSYAGLVIGGDINAGWIENGSGLSSETIYLQNTNNSIRIYTSGSENSRFVGGGLHVGNTTTPTGRFRVTGRGPNNFITEYLTRTGSIRAGFYETDKNGLALFIYSGSGDTRIRISSNDDNYFVNNTAFGKTSANHPLDVAGTTLGDSVVAAFDHTDGANAWIKFDNSTGTSTLGASGNDIHLRPTSGDVYINASGLDGRLFAMDNSVAGSSYGAIQGSRIYLVSSSVTNVNIQSEGTTYFNGGNVAFGGTVANAKVDVQGGDVYIMNSGSNARVLLGDTTSVGQYGGFQWDSNNDMMKLSGATGTGQIQNVAITDTALGINLGSGVVPSYNLEVVGTSSVDYAIIDGNESWHKGNLPVVISGSDQLAENISGSFTSLSGSISTRFTTNESDFNTFSSSYSTRITNNETTDSATSASFSTTITTLSSSLETRITNDSSSLESRVTINEATVAKTLLSGSTQIAVDISGSFTSTSASFSTDITTLSGSLESRITSVSSSLESRVTTVSSSFEDRISVNEATVAKTLLSGSEQIVREDIPDRPIDFMTYSDTSTVLSDSDWGAISFGDNILYDSVADIGGDGGWDTDKIQYTVPSGSYVRYLQLEARLRVDLESGSVFRFHKTGSEGEFTYYVNDIYGTTGNEYITIKTFISASALDIIQFQWKSPTSFASRVYAHSFEGPAGSTTNIYSIKEIYRVTL